MPAFKNHSQIEEFRLSPKEEWKRRLRADDRDSWGSHTTLGHAYSIILERLAQKGLDATPEPRRFLRVIDEHLEARSDSYKMEKALGLSDLSLNSKTYYPEFTRPITAYMKEKGLNDQDWKEIMLEILGNTGY